MAEKPKERTEKEKLAPVFEDKNAPGCAGCGQPTGFRAVRDGKSIPWCGADACHPGRG